MATCEAVIRSAFRRARLRAAGVPLDDVSAEVGLERLQGLYQQLANGLLGRVVDYYLTSGAYTAEENQRIYKASPASVITIPSTITDADTGETRAPLDGAFIVVVDPVAGTSALHLYNAIMGQWQDVDGLALADTAPLSLQFEEAIKDLLAVALLSETGVEPSKGLARNAGMGRLALATRPQTKSKSAVLVYY